MDDGSDAPARLNPTVLFFDEALREVARGPRFREVAEASAAEAIDRLDQHRTAVNAAVAAGVERIVYLSFLGARFVE